MYSLLDEQGIYGLSEAVEEINKLSKLIKSKDNEIDNLIKELNSINLKLSNTQDELDYLKEIVNADDDLKQKLNEESDVKNDKLKILKLQKEVIRLDAEKLTLYEELLTYKLGGSLGAKKINLFDQSTTGDQITNRSTASETNKVNSAQDTNDHLPDIKQLQKLNLIHELENENRELQLAMKEILIGLKESDSTSDVVIDCPSLERLCQFFESRSINSNLANVIALKAELDILRGHNEELRMTNKRLRNDIFKIFENYSKQLLTDFVAKHHDKTDDVQPDKDAVPESDKNADHINQTLTEDELYDSDLSEGEIVLNSRSIVPNRTQDQVIQTDLDYQMMNEFDLNQKERKSIEKVDDEQSSSDSSSDLDKHSSSVVHQTDQDSSNRKNDDSKRTDQPLLNGDQNVVTTDRESQTSPMNEMSFTEQFTQTELSGDELGNVNYSNEIDEIKQILKFKSIEDLKEMINQRESTVRRDSMRTSSDLISKQDATSQTLEPPADQAANCSQCSLVQNLLIEFQTKIDRIDSGIVQREDLYTERIHVLQDENNRLQTELQRIVQIKDDLLNQKEKQIIELNDKIVDQKERIIDLEAKLTDAKNVEWTDKESRSKGELPTTVKTALTDKETNSIDQSKLDKQSIDGQLALINKGTMESSNQRGLINILETIIKCLQTRIEHKDEAIAHYQQLLTKTQEEHQQEIQKLMKNYKKVTEHSIKAIQSTSSVNQEQLETTLVKYSDQLNEFKAYHQKVLAEQKKALELQSGKLKRLKTENERLKVQASSTDELNRLRTENDELNELVKKNVKFIEKLKSAIKEERAYKQECRTESRQDNEPGKQMQLNKLKEETENLYALLTSKDKQIKELRLSKWNLEKKIDVVMQANKVELKAKADELEKMIGDQAKLKSLLEKIEKEKSVLRRRQVTVIKEPTPKAQLNKEIQTDKSVNFDLHNQENALFIDKFKQLDQTITTLKQQLQDCAHRERELVGLLEQKTMKRESTGNAPSKKEFSLKSIKARTFEINKKNSCDF